MSTRINFGSGIVVGIPDTGDVDSWKVIKDESSTPDKDGLLLAAYQKKFPHLKFKDTSDIQACVDVIYGICSRSKAMQAWLASFNADYALGANVPEYYKSLLETDDITAIQEGVSAISKIESERSSKLQEESIKYKTSCESINKKSDEAINKITSKNELVKIMALNTTDLPASLAIAIENYVPAADEVSQKTYAREILVNFKVALIEAVKKDPKFNVTKFIEDSSTK
jgi:hypothetical protein